MNNEIVKRIISSIILVPVTLFFIVKGTFFFNFFILICFIIICSEWHMMTKKKPYSVFGIFFLIFSFYSIYKLRNEFIGDYIYILLITLICISTDIGGYLFGKLFKGPKLTKLSPKKTYSGMIGGYFLAIITIATLYSYNLFFLKTEDLTLNIFIFIILVSSVSQLGDIFISYFKRISKIKDTGKIIPGHGGLLDRADGMIFAFPFSYIILKLEIFQYF